MVTQVPPDPRVYPLPVTDQWSFNLELYWI